jgi:WD40 repeat protein
MRIFSNVYQIYQLSGHKASIRSIKTSQNKILTASEDGSVRLFNTRKSRGKVIVEHLNSVTSALFWERGVVSASADRMLKVWQKDKEVVSVSAHKSGITKLRLLNETTAVTGGYDGAVKLWSLLDPKPSPLLSFQDFTGDISVLEVSDNYISCASSNDDFIILHDLQSPSSQRTIDR